MRYRWTNRLNITRFLKRGKKGEGRQAEKRFAERVTLALHPHFIAFVRSIYLFPKHHSCPLFLLRYVPKAL